MNEPTYSLSSSADRLTFAFLSISPTRTIHKQVLYDPINELIYNLALVDVMPDGSLVDNVISDNGDMPKVIATVIQTMFAFFTHYPDKQIYFQGSDEARTRFYRILIGRELEQARKLFLIYGKKADGSWNIFVPNEPYTGFIFEHKS